MNDELKACPFCGAKLTKSVVDRETFYQHPMVNGCHLRAMLFTKYKWNTRPIEDALRLRIAELEESDKHWAGNVKVCMQLIERYESDIAELEAELKITDELLKEATEAIGAVVACCTYNSNDDAKIGIYGIDQKAFTRIDQFITHYNDAVYACKVSVDVKRELTDAEIEAENAELKERVARFKKKNKKLKASVKVAAQKSTYWDHQNCKCSVVYTRAEEGEK